MFQLFKSKQTKPLPAVAQVSLLPGSEGEHCLQNKYDTRQRALRFYDKQVLSYLSPVMKAFIAKQEVLFIATADKHGECDCSFRFGKPGFVRALNENYLVYPEYRGNGVMASQGNMTENPHIGMIFVDFFDSTVGLHVNGKAKVVEHQDLLKYRKELPQDVIDEINAEGRLRPERWIMVEIEEAYIHCSKHIPLLKKVDKQITWGTDDEGLKRSDFFALHDIPLYKRIGGESAIQVLAETVIRKLLVDNKLSPFLAEISLQNLLDKQKFFLKTVFGAHDSENLPENLRAFYRQQTSSRLNEAQLDSALAHLNNTLIELEVPEHEIAKLMKNLELKSYT
jgi:truncated hemoglobin YjbI/predicted pyridoxine 5'-phosphate oxidase superfamily flavin-nucleotide-binding protein